MMAGGELGGEEGGSGATKKTWGVEEEGELGGKELCSAAGNGNCADT